MPCPIFYEYITLLLRAGRILNVSLERLVNNITRGGDEEQGEHAERK